MIAYDQPLVPNRSSFQADPASAVADVVRRVVPQFVPANLRLRQGPTNQSIRDAITGLFSRHYLEDSLGREFARARLSSDTLSIVVLHVDNFRRFTHECGRAAGNTLLQVIGHLVKSQIRPTDIACRFGTEQFAFAMLGAPTDAALDRAKQLRQKFTTVGWWHNIQLTASVTLSAGIASFPDHAAQ